MERIDKIRGSLEGCSEDEFENSFALDDLRWAVNEIERLVAYPKAVDEIKSRYPTDVFPDGEGSGGKFARSLCDRIHETAAEIIAAAKAEGE